MSSLSTQLEQLESAQLIRRLAEDELAYLFKHALTQESAYESLLVKTRRTVHRRVAEAIERVYAEQLDEYAAVLAAHYAEAGDDRKTAAFALRAGERAASISAYVEASSHFTTALGAMERLPDTEQNRQVRIDTAIKQINVTWGIDPSEENLARLLKAQALAEMLQQKGKLALARVYYWIARIYSYRNELVKAGTYYPLILSAANESSDKELYVLSLALAGGTYFMQGNFARAVPLLREALPDLERYAIWSEWLRAKVFLAISLGAEGHYREGMLQGEEAIQKAATFNDRISLAMAYLMAARVEFMAGDVGRMLEVVRAWLPEAEATAPLMQYMALGFQAWAEGRQGDFASAQKTMAECYAVAARLGSQLIFVDWFAAARAEIELASGETKQALHLAEQAVIEAREAGGIFSEGIAQRVWGQALAALNGPEDGQGEAHLEKSAQLLEEGEAVVEAARTHLACGQLLQARGRPDAAREHLAQAAARFEEVGLTRELDRTRHLLNSLSA